MLNANVIQVVIIDSKIINVVKQSSQEFLDSESEAYSCFFTEASKKK